MRETVDGYRNLRYSGDVRERTVAERQLARLEQRPHGGERAANRWRHVSLEALFEQAGNVLHRRAGGRLECGHEPVHGSKSGRCTVIDPERGLWWCSSCRRGGDAITFLMQARGWSYHHAAIWLSERYGPPHASDSAPAANAKARGR